MGNLYSENSRIDKKRSGKEIGYSCININCKNFKRETDLEGNLI